MKPFYKDLSAKLTKNQIRPSIQRIKVLEYLANNRGHPTVDQIYKDLQGEIPTISKTTIYNTLDLFLATGLVQELTIDDLEARYDIITEPHGHLKCNQCGTIFNFTIAVESLPVEELTGFRITDRNVYFKGVCPKCLANIKSN
jgi:Fur family transcriptional regulator, peroxide stress response regulator